MTAVQAPSQGVGGRGGEGGATLPSITAEVFVGIDVHRGKHQAVIIPRPLFLPGQGGPWEKVKPLSVVNTRPSLEALARAIAGHGADPGQVAIAVDHTGGHYSAPLVHFLTQRGYQVFFLHAKALKQVMNGVFATEDKTDRLDARGMAFYLYARRTLGVEMRVTIWTPDPTPTRLLLGSLARQQRNLTRLHTRATNHLRHLLSSTFPEGEAKHFEALADVARFFPTPQAIAEQGGLPFDQACDYLPAKVRASLKVLAQDSVGIPAEHLSQAITGAAWQRYNHKARLKALADQIKEALAQHPYAPIITSFPGIGEAGAATLIATIGQVERFPTLKEFRKHLGVYVVNQQSGENRPVGKMGREGSRDARRVLFQAVFTCLSPRHPPTPFRDYYHKKLASTKPIQTRKRGVVLLRKPSIVATMGKFAEVLYHCLMAGERYTAPHPTPPQEVSDES